MSATEIEVPAPDGVADAYLSGADADAPRPGVLLLMDAFGLRPQIERMADAIAAEGFTVLAPNVFYRAGRDAIGPLPDLTDPERRGELFQRIGPLMQQLTPELIVRDGGAYLDALERVARGPFAITGYCMGGRLGWRIAAAYPDRVAALGAFHAGGLVTGEPDSPHLIAAELRAEVYLGHADQDPSMTAENIAELERALEAAGVSYTSEVYEGAAHGYTMADTAAYDEAAAERHRRALSALLERTIAR